MGEEKKEKRGKKNTAKIILRLINLITIMIALCVVLLVMNIKKKESEPEITNTFINNKLEAAGELTSARMIYNGLIRYSDGKIPFITKKAFTMTYRAQIKAGIDLAGVKSEVTDSRVTIRIPEIEIQDILIDEDSIQYYDEKFALLNAEKKEDALMALEKAKEDVRENGDIDELKKAAGKQTETLLKSLFQDSIGERKLIIEISGTENN